MTLRNKTIMIIGVTLLGLVVVLYTLSQFILVGSFARLEEQDTTQNIERARDAISNDIAGLDSLLLDWAPWDDTYIFIQDDNEDYIRSNLGTVSFTNIKINLMLFINSSGHIIYGKAFDLEKGEEIPVPLQLQKLSVNDILLNHTYTESYVNGIILLPEGPMLVASRPILTTDRKGPIRGTIIMGKFLDSAEIKRLAGITHLSLSSSLFSDPNTPDFQSAVQALSKKNPILIQPISNELIAGYVLLDDIEGNPAVVMKAELPRGIHNQGENTIRYIVFSIIGSGLVFGIVILLLLEKNVLSRLSFLSSNVSAIGTTGDRSMRVFMTGKDELSSLAAVINSMLEELEKAEEAKKKQLLLKEIYHRVKNNLQIVMSLMSLQSQKVKDKEIVEIFKDSQNRIKSMALIHERLFKSKDLAGIHFKDYIQDLANNLLRSYGVNDGSINLRLDAEDAIMNLDTANPCGLIVNELVSNSLKHAFPEGRIGELLIKFNSENNEMLTLIVRDNGIGFPEDIDFRKTNTLGMQLVMSLVSQLMGTIELDRNNGTEFKITFKQIKDTCVLK